MTQNLALVAEALNASARDADIAARINAARARIEGRMVFTTSFGLEDQMVTHAIARSGADIEIVTLDTGRMFPETYDVWAATEKRYGLRIAAFHPKAEAVEALVARQGINGFYDGLEARKSCCAVRKVEPLGRALAGAGAWVTGLRAGQSAARQATPFAEADAARGLIKLNPIHDWDAATLNDHVRALEIPYNALHDQGFPSIGCQPCTRAVRVGEHERAGRWWWEQSDQECGLHVAKPAAKPSRAA